MICRPRVPVKRYNGPQLVYEIRLQLFRKLCFFKSVTMIETSNWIFLKLGTTGFFSSKFKPKKCERIWIAIIGWHNINNIYIYIWEFFKYDPDRPFSACRKNARFYHVISSVRYWFNSYARNELNYIRDRKNGIESRNFLLESEEKYELINYFFRSVTVQGSKYLEDRSYCTHPAISRRKIENSESKFSEKYKKIRRP